MKTAPSPLGYFFQYGLQTTILAVRDRRHSELTALDIVRVPLGGGFPLLSSYEMKAKPSAIFTSCISKQHCSKSPLMNMKRLLFPMKCCIYLLLVWLVSHTGMAFVAERVEYMDCVDLKYVCRSGMKLLSPNHMVSQCGD